MDVLESMLRPAAAMINRQISSKTPARELCRNLSGQSMAVRVRHSSLAAYLRVEDDEVLLSTSYDQEPDVVISGTLLSLARLAGPAGDELIRSGAIEVIGNALSAQQFQTLLRFGRPDLEEELSSYVGDVVAHGIGEFVRSVSTWGHEAHATMQQNVSEYLQEERRTVPTRIEIDAFQKRVNILRDDVARIEARINMLDSERNSNGPV